MSNSQLNEMLGKVADVVAEGREHFKSNTAHATFAGELAESMARDLRAYGDEIDPAAFVMGCMPRAWVGSNKSNAWEWVANGVAWKADR